MEYVIKKGGSVGDSVWAGTCMCLYVCVCVCSYVSVCVFMCVSGGGRLSSCVCVFVRESRCMRQRD